MVWYLFSGWDISYLDCDTHMYNCRGCLGEPQSWKDICIRRSPSDIHILCGSQTASELLLLAVEGKKFSLHSRLCVNEERTGKHLWDQMGWWNFRKNYIIVFEDFPSQMNYYLWNESYCLTNSIFKNDKNNFISFFRNVIKELMKIYKLNGNNRLWISKAALLNNLRQIK